MVLLLQFLQSVLHLLQLHLGDLLLHDRIEHLLPFPVHIVFLVRLAYRIPLRPRVLVPRLLLAVRVRELRLAVLRDRSAKSNLAAPRPRSRVVLLDQGKCLGIISLLGYELSDRRIVPVDVRLLIIERPIVPPILALAPGHCFVGPIDLRRPVVLALAVSLRLGAALLAHGIKFSY